MKNLESKLLTPIKSGLLLILAISLVTAMPSFAAKNSGKQDKIRAAFMFGFIKNTDWTFIQSTNINFCVFGFSEMSSNMSRYLAKRVQDKTLSITVIKNGADIKDNCHAIYIPDQKNTTELFSSIAKLPILTVGEIVELADSKTLITFARSGIKLKYNVNKTRAEKLGLKFSEKLLKSAAKVN